MADDGGMGQRGDAEMAQKLWRVVRACVEMGAKNPIKQIHDQGAGGNCNVVRVTAWPLCFNLSRDFVRHGKLPVQHACTAGQGNHMWGNSAEPRGKRLLQQKS